jgi:hypothetical protein
MTSTSHCGRKNQAGSPFRGVTKVGCRRHVGSLRRSGRGSAPGDVVTLSAGRAGQIPNLRLRVVL